MNGRTSITVTIHNRRSKSYLLPTMVSSTASIISVSTAASTSSLSGGAPKPVPMAIMRNAHEVIRGAMQDIQEALDKDDFETAREMWHRFNRFSDLHMKMEEGNKDSNLAGLFGLVDEHRDKAAKKAGLRHQHSNLYELEEDVVDIFEKAPDVDRAKEVFPIFRQENENHLKEEEDVLMPEIRKMMKSGVQVKKLIQTEIVPVLLQNEGDIEFFVRFGNEVLARHESDEKTRVRVWNQALWSLATPEQWKEWKVWIKDSLSEENNAEVNAAIQGFINEQQIKKSAKSEMPPMPTIDLVKRANNPKTFFQRLFSSSSA